MRIASPPREARKAAAITPKWASRQTEGQSAAAPSPFPPIAEYAFLSNCHTGALVAPDGAIDWLCVPCFDAPERVRQPARPGGGILPVRPVRHQPSVRPQATTPGTNVLVTTWKTPSGWVRRSRRADHGAAGSRGRDHAAHAARRPTTTPTTCSCAPSSASRAASRWSWCASPRSTTAGPRPSGPRSTAAGTPPTPRGAGATIRLSSDLALGIEGNRVRARHISSRATARTARSPGPRAWPGRRTSTRPRPAWPPPAATGARGWTGPAYPTTASATRCSARRSRSRA